MQSVPLGRLGFKYSSAQFQRGVRPHAQNPPCSMQATGKCIVFNSIRPTALFRRLGRTGERYKEFESDAIRRR